VTYTPRDRNRLAIRPFEPAIPRVEPGVSPVVEEGEQQFRARVSGRFRDDLVEFTMDIRAGAG